MDWKAAWRSRYADRHGPSYDLGCARDEFLFLSDVVFSASPNRDLVRLEQAISALQVEVEETRDMASHIYNRLLVLRDCLQSSSNSLRQSNEYMIDEGFKSGSDNRPESRNGSECSQQQQKMKESQSRLEQAERSSDKTSKIPALAATCTLEGHLRRWIGPSYHIADDGPWFDQMGNIHVTKDLSRLLPGLSLQHVDSVNALNIIESPRQLSEAGSESKAALIHKSESQPAAYNQAIKQRTRVRGSQKAPRSGKSPVDAPGKSQGSSLPACKILGAIAPGITMEAECQVNSSRYSVETGPMSSENEPIRSIKSQATEKSLELPQSKETTESDFAIDLRTRPSKESIERLGLLRHSCYLATSSRQRRAAGSGNGDLRPRPGRASLPRLHRSVVSFDLSDEDSAPKLSPISEELLEAKTFDPMSWETDLAASHGRSRRQISDASSLHQASITSSPSECIASLASQDIYELQTSKLKDSGGMFREDDFEDELRQPYNIVDEYNDSNSTITAETPPGHHQIRLNEHQVSETSIPIPKAFYLTLKREKEELESILQDLDCAINDTDSDNTLHLSDKSINSPSLEHEKASVIAVKPRSPEYSPLRLPSPILGTQVASIEIPHFPNAVVQQDDHTYNLLEKLHLWKYVEDRECPQYYKIMTVHEDSILAEAMNIVLPPDRYRSLSNPYTHLEDECHRSLSGSSQQASNISGVRSFSRASEASPNWKCVGNHNNQMDEIDHVVNGEGFEIDFIEDIAHQQPKETRTGHIESQLHHDGNNHCLASPNETEYQEMLLEATIPLRRCRGRHMELPNGLDQQHNKAYQTNDIVGSFDAYIGPRLRGGGDPLACSSEARRPKNRTNQPTPPASPKRKRQREVSPTQIAKKMHTSCPLTPNSSEMRRKECLEFYVNEISLPGPLSPSNLSAPNLPPSPVVRSIAIQEIKPGSPTGMIESFNKQYCQYSWLLQDHRVRLQNECLYAQELLCRNLLDLTPDLLATSEEIRCRLQDLPRALQDRFLYNFRLYALGLMDSQSLYSITKSKLKGSEQQPKECNSKESTFNWVWPLLERFAAVFTSSRGNEYFCEIDEEYLTDRFNLTGLNTEVQYYQYALDLVTDAFDLDCDDDMREQIEKSARHLYGLVHQRYIITTKGLSKMVDKFKKGDFGKCPRVACAAQPLLPMGQSDNANVSAVKLYCARCEDLYNPKSSRHAAVDGAYFGTTFHNILFQVYPALQPKKSQRRYEPKIFGFKLHAAAALARWQNQEKEAMKNRLRDQGLETGFEAEDEDDDAELEDNMDDHQDGIDEMYEGREPGAVRK